MSYLPPPAVAIGDAISAQTLNRYRAGLTQWEALFNFGSALPDVNLTHRTAKFLMWSYAPASTAEVTQFNAASVWPQNRFAFVLLCVNANNTAAGAVSPVKRPASGSQSVTVGSLTLRVYSDGTITMQSSAGAGKALCALFL